ncbi:MAG: cytochrome C [Spirochaetes bacterium]|nr:MAG: cytochrome C [Spirochaetota bacterium]
MRGNERVKKIAIVFFWASILSVPLWWNLVRGTVRELPRPEMPVDVKECVLPAAEMRANHMNLLIAWREDAVRRGDRAPITVNGTLFEKSLTGTCLACHRKKDAFCDRCHNAVASHPACFDCHSDSAGARP